LYIFVSNNLGVGIEWYFTLQMGGVSSHWGSGWSQISSQIHPRQWQIHYTLYTALNLRSDHFTFLVNKVNSCSLEFMVEGTSNNKCISELLDFTFLRHYKQCLISRFNSNAKIAKIKLQQK